MPILRVRGFTFDGHHSDVVRLLKIPLARYAVRIVKISLIEKEDALIQILDIENLG
jgi:hypothetical protein